MKMKLSTGWKKWSTGWKWNGEQYENEMDYRIKMKWSTGWKWNGVQDENEME